MLKTYQRENKLFDFSQDTNRKELKKRKWHQLIVSLGIGFFSEHTGFFSVAVQLLKILKKRKMNK